MSFTWQSIAQSSSRVLSNSARCSTQYSIRSQYFGIKNQFLPFGARGLSQADVAVRVVARAAGLVLTGDFSLAGAIALLLLARGFGLGRGQAVAEIIAEMYIICMARS